MTDDPKRSPLDAAALRQVMLPLERARSLPQSAYLGEQVFAFEREHVLSAGWHCVGREADVLEAGQWLRASPGGQDVIVARGEDDDLHAFYNVCRHRGSPLVSADAGHCETFECPYHGWTYATTGALLEAPHASLPTLHDCDLSAVRVDVWQGFVFIAFRATLPDLEAWMGDVPPWFDRNDLSALRRARRTSWEAAANWKHLVANFQESQHFPRVHPALESLTPTSRAGTHLTHGPWLGGTMEIQNETVSMSGKRGARPCIVGEEDTKMVFDAMLFPCLLTSLQPDYFLTYRLEPVSADRTRVIAEIFVHPDMPPDADLSDVFSFWDTVNAEDRAICERQQHGVASAGFSPGPYTSVDEGVHAFEQRVARLHLGPSKGKGKLNGIWGHPYIDLSPFLDTSSFRELDLEIMTALGNVETTYTGGTLKWMGVVAPWLMDDGYADAMDVIEGFSREEFERFIALGDEPEAFDLAHYKNYTFGDETDHPFNLAQMRYLSQRYGVYFPWKVCFHFLENDRWDDKHSGSGKAFGAEAEEHFPKTVAFIKSLPFREIGRAVLFGLEPNDHAPAHRDTEPGKALQIAQSINFDPRGNKGMYLADPEGESQTVIDAPIYWFNDMDYHGVLAAPRFRYSIRVDGVFEPSFLKRVRGRAH